MTKKQFKDLITEKTGLSYAEYDDVVAALKKYDINIEEAASQIDVNPTLVGLALPDTSNEVVPYTAQDKVLADKLDLDVETVSKFTTWAEEFGNTIDKVDNLPFGIGDKVTEAIENNGLSDYIGPDSTKSDIAGSINSAIDAYERTHKVTNENTAEGATNDASKKEETVAVPNRGSENDATFNYVDTDARYKLEGKGDKMYVYDLDGGNGWFAKNQENEPKLVTVVDCPANQREEFVSEMQEKDLKIDGFSKQFALADAAHDVAKDIKGENEFSTGNEKLDKERDRTENKAEELEDKLENLKEQLEKADSVEGFWGKMWDNNGIKDMLTNAIADTQKELDACHEKLEKFEALEVENAKEMKEKLEATQKALQDEYDKVSTLSSDNVIADKFYEARANTLKAELDEIGDRLDAIDNKLANATVTDSFTNEEIKDMTATTFEKLWGNIKEIDNKADNTFDKVGDYLQDFHSDMKENIQDFIKNPKESIKSFVVNVDNIVNDWKDDVVAWGKDVAEKSPAVSAVVNGAQGAVQAVVKDDDVQEFVQTVKDVAGKVNDRLEPVVDYVKDIGNNAREFIDNQIDKAKEAVNDAKEWISDKWNSFKNLFDKDDEVELDIED